MSKQFSYPVMLVVSGLVGAFVGARFWARSEPAPAANPGFAETSAVPGESDRNGLQSEARSRLSVSRYQVASDRHVRFHRARYERNRYGLQGTDSESTSDSWVHRLNQQRPADNETYIDLYDWANSSLSPGSQDDSLRERTWTSIGGVRLPRISLIAEDGLHTIHGVTSDEGFLARAWQDIRQVIYSLNVSYQVASYQRFDILDTRVDNQTRTDLIVRLDLTEMNQPGDDAANQGSVSVMNSPFATDAEASRVFEGPIVVFGPVWTPQDQQSDAVAYRSGSDGNALDFRGDVQEVLARGDGSSASWQNVRLGLRTYPIPEPACITMMALGYFAIAGRRRH